MCHALYIASERPLPLIEWDEKNPGFWVGSLQEHEESVKNQFSLPFVVYAGSFEGCSCGFVFDDEPVEADEFERQYDSDARKSVKKLSEYLADRLQTGPVELFSCWEGEQAEEPEERIVVGLEFFNGEEFGFERRTHVKVVT